MFQIVFHNPEIPPNTGNAMRLAAVTGCSLHLIEPLGFDLDDAKLRRAGLDYRDKMTLRVHSTVDAWLEDCAPANVYAFTVDGESVFSDLAYRPGDVLLFGRESVGLPDHVKAAPWVTRRARLPMVDGVRSVNLSNAAAIVVYEAWRQNGFAGSR